MRERERERERGEAGAIGSCYKVPPTHVSIFSTLLALRADRSLYSHAETA